MYVGKSSDHGFQKKIRVEKEHVVGVLLVSTP